MGQITVQHPEMLIIGVSPRWPLIGRIGGNAGWRMTDEGLWIECELRPDLVGLHRDVAGMIQMGILSGWSAEWYPDPIEPVTGLLQGKTAVGASLVAEPAYPQSRVWLVD